jgi:ribosomal protein S5
VGLGEAEEEETLLAVLEAVELAETELAEIELDELEAPFL